MRKINTSKKKKILGGRKRIIELKNLLLKKFISQPNIFCITKEITQTLIFLVRIFVFVFLKLK